MTGFLSRYHLATLAAFPPTNSSSPLLTVKPRYLILRQEICHFSVKSSRTVWLLKLGTSLLGVQRNIERLFCSWNILLAGNWIIFLAILVDYSALNVRMFTVSSVKTTRFTLRLNVFQARDVWHVNKFRSKCLETPFLSYSTKNPALSTLQIYFPHC